MTSESATPASTCSSDDSLLHTLRVVDPLLQFLTKSTGHVSVPLSLLGRTIPSGVVVSLDSVRDLQRFGIVRLNCEEPAKDPGNGAPARLAWESSSWYIGFPQEESLRGSTKTAAKRRLAALKKKQKAERTALSLPSDHQVDDSSSPTSAGLSNMLPVAQKSEEPQAIQVEQPVIPEEQACHEAPAEARETLVRIFGEIKNSDKQKDTLYDQFNFAGSFPAQKSVFSALDCSIVEPELLTAFGLVHESNPLGKKLYRHQVQAIHAVLLDGRHTAVCTGTGSGKSVCFWLPILSEAATKNVTSLVMFPTKALAQDQLSKLNAILARFPGLSRRIRPATLDGDTPQSSRSAIASSSNILLTNPDTLHAAILPNAKTLYADFLASLQYVVLDEAHVYSGAFGANVSLVLRRLARVACERSLLFLAASATLQRPEEHFRRLCPIAPSRSVEVIVEDFSPRAAKHFFVQNPPLLANSGAVIGVKRPRATSDNEIPTKRRALRGRLKRSTLPNPSDGVMVGIHTDDGSGSRMYHRRHAADETALLLIQAVRRRVRCIVFCKTRNLVEWVYERASKALEKLGLGHLLESYRGGYTYTERREIETKLFSNKLLGVVATNALELGVDVGGIDLTLHVGFPSSHASLLQQAGRAGRGASCLPSLSVMVCFNSSSEQHMWRHPSTLLCEGIAATTAIPVPRLGILQGHILCASNEVPLSGEFPVTVVVGCSPDSTCPIQSDWELFGGRKMYEQAVQVLLSTGSLVKETVAITNPNVQEISVHRGHYSMLKAWNRVSIRSIEPITYAIVNLAHHGQGGRMDAIHDDSAVMDTIPYSRVFYHAHPGAIITHRGQKYRVVSMMRPPAFLAENFSSSRRSSTLAAFAKPTAVRYNTRPLSNMYITVIKRLETVEVQRRGDSALSKPNVTSKPESALEEPTRYTVAGCGYVGVKRSVHGYKKLSLITRAELSRAELTLPPMEYDTVGLWFDAGAAELLPLLGDKYGRGVHALSHAMLAVAPLVCPGVCRSDIQCDHQWFEPTSVMLFDERAGGSGACQSLWDCIFKPDGIVHTAVKLLEQCAVCSRESGYDGGCPECLHDSNCIKFNMHLSRSSAITIGQWMLARIEETDLYKTNAATEGESAAKNDDTPRRSARKQALRNATAMSYAKERQIVVGRPSWPMDGDSSQHGRREEC